jgi:KaiC/GvpD/RAD55 family RecA-like ATPase
MKKKIQLLSSGISLVDSAWSGFYRGGTYFMIGAHKTGKTLLGLQFAMESTAQKEVCLYFTSKRPKDLIIQAASIDFDLQEYMNKNMVIVVKVTPPTEADNTADSDQVLVDYLKNIITVVEQYQPSKIVFDELTPFIGFRNITHLQNNFLKTIEAIEEFGITSLFILGEPATSFAEKIVDAITTYATGMIYLRNGITTEKPFHGGRMIIIPNIGHTQGKFSAEYIILPNKGVTTDIMPPSISSKIPSLSEQDSSPVPGPGSNVPPKSAAYRPLIEIDTSGETASHSNYYNIDDFTLLVNNQIALYKTTGQIFTILSFRLDRKAELKGLLTVSQLQNAVRLSTDRRDKICVLSNNVVVLITREENQKGITSLISKIKTNLPFNDPEYIKSVIPYISVFSVKVNESVNNANDIISLLTPEESQDKNKLGL